jgi:hypothetical protein
MLCVWLGRGTLLGPEVSVAPVVLGVVVSSAVILLGLVGFGGWFRSLLENCIVDASIFSS